MLKADKRGTIEKKVNWSSILPIVWMNFTSCFISFIAIFNKQVNPRRSIGSVSKQYFIGRICSIFLCKRV